MCVCVCERTRVRWTVLSAPYLAVTLKQGQCDRGRLPQSPVQCPAGRDRLLGTLERQVHSTYALKEYVQSPRKHREDFYKVSLINDT